MTVTELEQRVATLERELHELKASLRKTAGEKDWRSTAGIFTGDEVFAEMVREGRKYREQQREADAESQVL